MPNNTVVSPTTHGLPGMRLMHDCQNECSECGRLIEEAHAMLKIMGDMVNEMYTFINGLAPLAKQMAEGGGIMGLFGRGK